MAIAVVAKARLRGLLLRVDRLRPEKRPRLLTQKARRSMMTFHFKLR